MSLTRMCGEPEKNFEVIDQSRRRRRRPGWTTKKINSIDLVVHLMSYIA